MSTENLLIYLLKKILNVICVGFLLCKTVFFLSICSSLRGFLDLSPCIFESYAHSLFPYRKQHWKCPRPFWNILTLEQQVKSNFSQKTPNKPNNRNYSKNCLFEKDRQDWMASVLPLVCLHCSVWTEGL